MTALTASDGPASGAPYRLDHAEMERLGRRRTYWRAVALVLVLLLLQQPLRLVATGWLASVAAIEPSVPARLSLLADGLMILAYVVLAVRAHEYAASRVAVWRPGRTAATTGLALVAVGAAMDVVENVVLWRSMVDSTAGEPVDLGLGWWSVVMGVAVVLGLLLGLGAVWPRAAERAPSPEPRTGGATADPPPAPTSGNRPGLVICCSGGGIRAAAFCLGGLQGLRHLHGQADAVIGVSGGGYVAAAHHVLRWRSSDTEGHPWAHLDPAAYARDSPEEKWLRRHSRYLLDSTRAGVIGVLSLLFGLAVNLLFLTALLGAAAWFAGWLLLASGGVAGWATETPTPASYTGDWRWLSWSWVVVAVGVGLFVVAKVVDRLWPTFDVVGRDRLRAVVVALVLGGVALLVVLQGLPALLVGLRSLAVGDHTHPLVSAVADLLRAMGFAPAAVVEAAGPADEASGRAVSGTSLAAIAAAVLATVKALGSAVTREGHSGGTGRLVSRVWTAVKDVVLPWVAAVVVVLLLVTVFLTWTVSLLNDPDDLRRWEVAGWYALALLAAHVLTDANRTSLHHFYRERLSSAYLVRRGEQDRPKALDYTEALRFSESTPPPGSGPSLVSCAVANVNDRDVVPTDRDCTPFVFTHDRIGLTEEILPVGATVPSGEYEFAADSRCRDATIPAAMAISGAAFSPLAGRENALIGPYRLVLALANARLGVWLPNPLWVDPADAARRRDRASDHRGWRWWEGLRSVVTKPSPFLVAREAVGRTSVLDRFLYVTDGGHYDNLGLVEALRRRPERVVLLDASNDPEDTFRAFGRAVSTARMDLGCDVELDPREMRRLTEQHPAAAWAHGTVRYRADADGVRQTGHLWIAKALVLADAPWDVETYRSDHPSFPRTSTAAQLYGEFDLEAYRALGEDVVRRMVVAPT